MPKEKMLKILNEAYECLCRSDECANPIVPRLEDLIQELDED